MKKTAISTSKLEQSVLIGNGVNINFGGAAYSNSFIIKRIIFNALAEKYDSLFNGKISGKEIAQLFRDLANWANEIRSGKYDAVVSVEDKRALASFKDRYDWEIKNYYDIGLEDWFFVLKVYLTTIPDAGLPWTTAKQGFEHMILDAIYNDGELNNLHKKMGTSVKRFFSQFNNIFTLNYDGNIDRLTKKVVYHLHGAYDTPANSENPQTVQGYLRIKNGESVVVPGFEHCYCNALLDYEGENKYRVAQAFEKAEVGLADLLSMGDVKIETNPIAEWIKIKRKHPELSFGTDYHFDKLKNLTGELHIIGLSPNNDSHIFKLIDESQVEKIVFYYFCDLDKKRQTKKPVTFVPVNELWKRLGANPRKYICRYPFPKADERLKIINCLSQDPIDRDTLITKMNEIPQFRVDALCKEAFILCESLKKQGNPKSEDELSMQFREISRVALREGILPSVLFAHLLSNFTELKQ